MKAISANDLVITEVLDEGWLMGIDTPNNGREIAITKELALGIIRLQQGTNPPTGHDHTHEFNIDSIRYVKDPILGGHTIPVKRCACGVTRKLSELSPAGHDHTGQELIHKIEAIHTYDFEGNDTTLGEALKYLDEMLIHDIVNIAEAEASRLAAIEAKKTMVDFANQCQLALLDELLNDDDAAQWMWRKGGEDMQGGIPYDVLAAKRQALKSQGEQRG